MFYAKIAENKTADVDELKTRLIDELVQFDQSIADAAISQWRRRPCASLCPGTRCTLSINSDTFKNWLLYKLIIMLNKPHFSLLHMLIKSLESLLQTTTQRYVIVGTSAFNTAVRWR